MKVKRKEWQLYLPVDLDEVWSFFSRPENLDRITPDDMSFHILSDITDLEMYQGMIIQYEISPFAGLKMDWVTEITEIKDRRYFIDEQRFGPYAFWHHQHHFKPQGNGVFMTDILHYKVPFGIIGTITDAIYVDRQIEKIFQFREKAVGEIFQTQMIS